MKLMVELRTKVVAVHVLELIASRRVAEAWAVCIALAQWQSAVMQASPGICSLDDPWHTEASRVAAAALVHSHDSNPAVLAEGSFLW